MIHTRQFTSTLVVRDGGDGRTLHGPVLPWGIEAREVDAGRLVTETFARGALEGTDPARVPLTATHPRDAGTLPIGVTVELRDEADAFHGDWRVSKTVVGDEVLELAADGVPLGLSIGLFSGERTLIDLFRLRHVWGSDLAIGALKRWVRARGNSPGALLALADSFPKARPAVQSALEVLL